MQILFFLYQSFVFRCKGFLTFLILAFSVFTTHDAAAQCMGLPSVTSLGSNKFPVGLCAPVHANVTYNIGFTSRVPEGSLELVYEWGDGSSPEVIPLNTSETTYSAARTHNFPAESDCEYFVIMTLRYNGILCTNTRQIQKIASWRTDAVNGGDVKLISLVTGTTQHEVCEGDDVDVVLLDKSTWNCNSEYIEQPPNPVESPNTEYRWQQIIYNTAATNKIPNIEVDGVPVTGANGQDIIANYQDPRGVFYMSTPVVADDSRKRPTLRVTAPGGFGAGFPKAGNVFEITLRYWNVCNPYDDPRIPGPPSDLINGDHPPVQSKAIIKIKAVSPAPVVTDQTVCNGTTPSAFSVSSKPSNVVVNWYRNLEGPDRPGTLISSGTASTLPITSHPNWVDNKKPGIYKVWASYSPKVRTAVHCEGPKVLISRIIREELTVPPPVTEVPSDICDNTSITITMPPPATEAIGGATSYTWSGTNGVTLTSSDVNSATFSINVGSFGQSLFVDRTITVTRKYNSLSACAVSKVFNIRIRRLPSGGTLSTVPDVCENQPVGTLTLSGDVGNLVQWEIKRNNEPYAVYNGEASDKSISPGTLTPGIYTFRAMIGNGTCSPAYSDEERVEVFENPLPAATGENQFFCGSLSSGPLGGSNPSPGTGRWSYISSVPAGLPPPDFTKGINDPNTRITIQAEHAGTYTLRWNVTHGACSSAADVVVDFGTTPSDPYAGEDKTVCGSTATLTGNVPDTGSGTWRVISGPGGCTGLNCPVSIASPASPSTALNLKGQVPAYGSYVFRWTISSGGNNCFLKHDDVVVRFDEPPQVQASDITDICLDPVNLTPIDLSGVIHGGNSGGNWMNVSGYGTVSLSTVSEGQSPTITATYTPSYKDYEIKPTVQVKLVSKPAQGSSCTATEKIINIVADRKPLANAGSDIPAICSDSQQLHAEAPSFNAKGRWTTSQPGVTFDDPSDPNTVVRNLPAPPNSITLTWTVTSASGKCIAAPSSIKLTRVSPPDSKDLYPTECEAGDGATSVVLRGYDDAVTDLAETNREITWYKDGPPPTGIPVDDPAAPQKDVINGQKYVARIRDIRSDCTSEAVVTISIRPRPHVRDGLVQLCEDVSTGNTASSIDLNQHRDVITDEKQVLVSWHSSESDAQNNLSPITSPVKVTGRKEVFARVIHEGQQPPCYAIGKLQLVVTPRPALTTISGRESVCQAGSSESMHAPVEIYQVAPLNGAKYFWEIPSDAQSQFKVFGGGKETDFYVLLQFPNVYKGKIRVRVEHNGCSGPVIEKDITVSPSPVKPIIKGVEAVCEDEQGIALEVSPNNYPYSTYYWEIRKASDNSPGGAHITNGQATGNILVNFSKEDILLSVRETNEACISPVATKLITVHQRPEVQANIENTISCFQERDGKIRAVVHGGTAPYAEYTLENGGEAIRSDNGVFAGLGPGSYRVKIRDAKGCTAESKVVTLDPPTPVVIHEARVLTDGNGYPISCRNASDGAIEVSFSGGASTDDHTVTLKNVNDPGHSVQLKGKKITTFTELPSGTYTVIAEDAKGCFSLPATAIIRNLPVFHEGLIGFNQSICSGEDPGRIEELMPPSGGVGNYNYEWQESVTGNTENDTEWVTIPGADQSFYDPPVLTTESGVIQRFYRRLVHSMSARSGTSCEVKGKTDKVTITVNPIPQVAFSTAATQVCSGEPALLKIDLKTGTGPIEYDYSAGTKIYLNQPGAANTVIPLSRIEEDATYTLLRVRDYNDCVAENLPQSVDIKVANVTADFTVLGESSQCSGSEFEFQWKVEAGIDYRWEWGDGTTAAFKAGTLTPGAHRLTHMFNSASGEVSSQYPVRLFASSKDCQEKFTSKHITVFPSLALNITADNSALCSGETITFYDRSMGVDKGTWYYHEPGENARFGEKEGLLKQVSYQFSNTTAKNPITYEVVYEAANSEGCTDEYRYQVTVYREVIANFDVLNVPVFGNGVSKVSFTNGSSPVDESDFKYRWNFGQDAVQTSSNGQEQVDVNYYSPGIKEVTLSAVNIEAGKAGLVCKSDIKKQIEIKPDELSARFNVSPRAACFPVDIEVENLTRGADAFIWKLYNEKGIVMSSNLQNPIFQISDPGTYRVHLTATYTATGKTDSMAIGGIEVLPIPSASFGVPTTPIFVPDTEVQYFNYTERANAYHWDFGDGFTSTDFEPKHAFSLPGNYEIALVAAYDHGPKDVDGNGLPDDNVVCYDTARRVITAIDGSYIKIPNAFTPSLFGPSGGIPGGSGFNDVFLPIVKGVVKFNMQIFDRWGTLVFESNDKDIGWDGYDRHGRLLPASVYVYRLFLDLANGERTTRVGDVTLIR